MQTGKGTIFLPAHVLLHRQKKVSGDLLVSVLPKWLKNFLDHATIRNLKNAGGEFLQI